MCERTSPVRGLQLTASLTSELRVNADLNLRCEYRSPVCAVIISIVSPYIRLTALGPELIPTWLADEIRNNAKARELECLLHV